MGTKENLDKAMAGEVAEMAMSKNWMRDMAAWEGGNPTALLGDIASMGLGLWDLYNKRQATKEANASGFAGSEASHNAGLAVGEVVAFTGCRSDQTSADVGNIHGQFSVNTGVNTKDHAGGALTAVFLESLLEHDDPGAPPLSYLALLERMRLRLQEEHFSQVPQLASSLLLELNQRFSLTTAFLPPDPRKQSESGGTDAADGALLAGGAACAAGFLATLAMQPHGAQMVSHAGLGEMHGGSAPFEHHKEISGEHGAQDDGSLAATNHHPSDAATPNAPVFTGPSDHHDGFPTDHEDSLGEGGTGSIAHDNGQDRAAHTLESDSVSLVDSSSHPPTLSQDKESWTVPAGTGEDMGHHEESEIVYCSDDEDDDDDDDDDSDGSYLSTS
mmetsp:Transcript_41436/g.74457  ORF Transcript_41436/g.74457 Transcript_41436/m.74457 type:complete len:387 (-) Transcript_41436:127-1287(-)